MSKTSEYFADYAEDFRQDGVEYVLSKTFAVLTDLHRSSPYGYDDYDLISFETLEEAENAFKQEYLRAKEFVEAAFYDRTRPGSVSKDITAYARVCLCVNLDIMLRPSDSFTNADLAWTGQTADGVFHFETDMDDLDQAITRDVNIGIIDYGGSLPEIEIEWSRGQVEIPAE